MVSAEVPVYSPQAIEAKWLRMWEQRRQYETHRTAEQQKYYLLEMLPYPSGDLHVGHARNYTIGDVMSRFMRMRGYNVLHPMGWDAFGLPAEAAAIARGLHPRDWTNSNIAKMRSQIRMLGTSYDWTREVNSSAPDYYRWTQWIFLLLYRKGLAYKAEAVLNWCPNDQTVLANEQAEGGVCWRCGHAVERRRFKQWFFRITRYADRLLEGLDKLEHWPERVRTMQRNWIGRSEGATVKFAVAGHTESIEVFTTRLDTLFGATFLAIAPEHPLSERLIASAPAKDAAAARAFVASVKNKTDLELQTMGKVGVFSGAYALNPLTSERIPVWITNYVVAEYGTGAVMGVPAHDQRDYDFAVAHHLPVRVVIAPLEQPAPHDAAFVDDGIVINSGEFTGRTSAQAREEIALKLERLGAGRRTVHYALRDWLISRERYWGAPIPMVECPQHGYVPVPEDQLPVLLPDNVPFSGSQGSPLEHVPEFVNTTCPVCGGPAKREVETMDTFMCSSWYYLRYIDPHDERAAWEVADARYWAPVDYYFGGIEHAVLHLMYARFIYKVFADEGLVPGDEPFSRLFNQGMVLGENHEKMSKSRGNTIAIDEAVERYGADALRLFELFAAPPEDDFPWSTTGINGLTRTLQRIWRLMLAHPDALRPASGAQQHDGAASDEREMDAALRYGIHSKLKEMTDELEGRLHFNTCVAKIMMMLNDLEAFAAQPDADRSAAFAEGMHTLLLVLAPFAPFIAEELWERTGHSGSVHAQRWPRYDERWLQRALIAVVVQVNGKRRATLEQPPGIEEADTFAAAREVPTVKAQLENKTVRKLVYVPDKLLNIVVD